MKYAIEIHFVKDKMPQNWEVVIVFGGIASFNGDHWISHTGESYKKRITWDVKWWAELIMTKDLDNAEEVITVSDIQKLTVQIEELKSQLFYLSARLDRIEPPKEPHGWTGN